MIINEHAYMILHDLKSQVTSVETYISHLKRDFILVICSHDGTSNRNFAVRKFSKFHQFVPMSAALYQSEAGCLRSGYSVVSKKFFHFLKRSGNSILSLFNNFKLFWILKIFKIWFGNSNFSIHVFITWWSKCIVHPSPRMVNTTPMIF